MEKGHKTKETNGTILPILLAVLLLIVIVTAVLLFQVLSIKKDLKPQMDAIKAVQAEDSTSEAEDIEIYLPETYYAATGLTMEIYNSQITNK